MKDKERPRGSVNIEEVTEETYSDLLPYEMERAEHAMDILFGLDRKQTASNKEEAGNIKRDMGRAKMTKQNRWGHPWRPSPDIRDAGPIRDKHGQLKASPPPSLPPDPINEKAISEFRASLEEDDNVPATD